MVMRGHGRPSGKAAGLATTLNWPATSGALILAAAPRPVSTRLPLFGPRRQRPGQRPVGERASPSEPELRAPRPARAAWWSKWLPFALPGRRDLLDQNIPPGPVLARGAAADRKPARVCPEICFRPG